MAWQNPHQSGWPTNDPITTQVGPVVSIPMHVIPGSLEGGSPYPPSGVPGVQPGPYPPSGVPGVQPGPYPPSGIPGVQPGPYQQPGVPPNAPLPAGGWPTPNSNCPAGLEYLMALDTIFVHQHVEVLEAITGWETLNKYMIKDVRGQVIFQVEEESNVCSRCCCGNNRPFDMKIINSSMREVLTVSRPLRCNTCLCPCFLQEMEVFASGTKLGSVVQNWNPFRPSYSVNDSNGNTILMIKGPMCMLCPWYDVNFKVLSSDGEHQVGRISKKWSDFVQELFTDADIFGISFPIDLDVKVKALLVASCLLIDFMYFEKSPGK
ncbi:phospholipid scramblase 2 isoform X2 [Cephus cinctus]|uniref:Phospholipid scramblase n=1 Tax=Cephus cinctus TaxID=211228 RepID=A0AAJ7FE30_CEPCN|nr:phospholipid scramblase 2 isoform X2 [Cephus cinctus]